jgi:hypothetical protein
MSSNTSSHCHGVGKREFCGLSKHENALLSLTEDRVHAIPGVLLLWQSRHAWPSADTWERATVISEKLKSYPQLPSCLWLRNCTSNAIITGNPAALVRQSLALAAGSQFNKWRSRNSVSARASETAVLSSDVCSHV